MKTRAAAVALSVLLAGAALPGTTSNYLSRQPAGNPPAKSVAETPDHPTGHPTDYPTDYFRSPLGIPILLSGSFAELRSNHFHSGLDIKTNATPGYRVYAAADGSVVRIRVSPTGFGNALYIRHPNGYTTVYAHLLNFADPIQEWVRGQQYRAKNFDVDLFPEPSLFPVSKGDVVALSGNSGSSGGPHLHFEIRDSATEWPVNPLLFGLEVRDTTPPQIRNVKIYALDSGSVARIRFASGETRTVSQGNPVLLQAVGNGRIFDLQGVRSISANGRLGFGIETRDYHEGSQSRLGPYRINLFADDEPVFEYLAEKFSFSNTRYINAHVDYPEHHFNKRWLQRSFLLPGNQLPSYKSGAGRGAVTFEDGVQRVIRYEVFDTPGNSTSLSFTVTGDGSLDAPAPALPSGELVPYKTGATFVRDGFRAEIPDGTFYEDTALDYEVKSATEKSFSPRHVFHDPATPLHNYIQLAIRADRLPARLRDKAALAYVDSDGKTSLQAAEYADGWASARTRSLGEYYVSADTVDPRIQAISLNNGSNIRFKTWDSETGIDSYEGLIDGKWVLFEYDAKTRMLVYTFDDRVDRGAHDLKLTVTDNVGNRSVYTAGITR